LETRAKSLMTLTILMTWTLTVMKILSLNYKREALPLKFESVVEHKFFNSSNANQLISRKDGF
jgi:hypothetical protein